MASEPKTIRESNLALAGLEGRFDFLQKMVWAVIALLGALISGAFALYSQIGEIKTDIAVVKTNLTTLKEQQSALQDSIRSLDSKSQASLSRIESRLSATDPRPLSPRGEDQPLNLAGGEIDLIRAFVKIVRTGKPSTVEIGTSIPDETLKPLPKGVTDKLPRLASYSYTFDLSGDLLLVSNRTRKVEGIISAPA